MPAEGKRNDKGFTPGEGTMKIEETGTALRTDTTNGPDDAAHFELVRDGILITAPFGMLGAAVTVAFMMGFARRLHSRGESMSAAALVSGGLLAACYLLAIQVVFTSLADGAAASSPEAPKALFVPTILAAPVFGLGTSVALGGAAFGATRSRLLPGWWSVTSAAAAAVAAIAVFSYADSNFVSPRPTFHSGPSDPVPRSRRTAAKVCP